MALIGGPLSSRAFDSSFPPETDSLAPLCPESRNHPTLAHPPSLICCEHSSEARTRTTCTLICSNHRSTELVEDFSVEVSPVPLGIMGRLRLT